MYAHATSLILIMLLVASSGEVAFSTGDFVGGPIWLMLFIALNPVVAWLQTRVLYGKENPKAAEDSPDFLNEIRVELIRSAIEVRQFIFWIATSLIITACFGWPQTVRSWFGSNRLTVVGELLIVAPALLAMLGNQIVLGRFESNDGSWMSVWRRLESQSRTIVAFVVWPLVLFAAGDVVVRNRESFSTAGKIILGFAAALAVWHFPRVAFRIVFVRKKLEQRLACELNSRLADHPLRHRVLFAKWDSKGTFCNALVLPTFAGKTQVLFSDLMVEFFDANELVAIARHELAHFALGHSLFRFAALAVPFAFLAMFEVSGWTDFVKVSGNFANPQLTFSGVAAIFFSSLAAVVLFRFVSIQSEFEADTASIELEENSLTDRRRRAEDLIMALEKLAYVFPSQATQSGWSHPSLKERIARLKSYYCQHELPSAS